MLTSEVQATVADFRHAARCAIEAGADVASGLCDLEAYGQMVLANPDFIARVKQDAPMNSADRNTFFGGTAAGDTDYATLAS